MVEAGVSKTCGESGVGSSALVGTSAQSRGGFRGVGVGFVVVT